MVNRPSNYDPYEGPLDPQDVATGIDAAISNAQGLLKAAELLFRTGSFPQSAVLGILAIEEFQKPFILLELLLAESDKQIKSLWAAYRRHPDKQKRFSKWIRISAWTESNPKFDKKQLETLLSDPTTDQNIIEFKKQLFLYSDRFVSSGWNFPSRSITKQEVMKILASAELELNRVAVYSPAELQIWKKYLVGFDSKSKVAKRRILLAFAEELCERGFAKPNWFDISLAAL